MKALVQEALVSIAKTKKNSFERDTAMIFYMGIIKHTEIAAYRTLRLTAGKLGYPEAKTLLTENMNEEKDNDKLFQLIARQYFVS